MAFEDKIRTLSEVKGLLGRKVALRLLDGW